jgi:hypothetical protein
MRRFALALAALGLAVPALAEPQDPLPNFDLDSAITCLAYTVSSIEQDKSGDIVASRAEWLVFFSRLIAVKSTYADTARFHTHYNDDLDYYRSLQAALDDPARRDEADMDLTGTGKMCWFQALAAEGGLYDEP